MHVSVEGGDAGDKTAGVVAVYKTSIVFAELGNARPRWVQLPLAYRPSCSCAQSATETATRAIKENPSSKQAWDKMKEWSVEN